MLPIAKFSAQGPSTWGMKYGLFDEYIPLSNFHTEIRLGAWGTEGPKIRIVHLSFFYKNFEKLKIISKIFNKQTSTYLYRKY